MRCLGIFLFKGLISCLFDYSLFNQVNSVLTKLVTAQSLASSSKLYENHIQDFLKKLKVSSVMENKLLVWCFNISCPNLDNNDYCNSHLRKLFNIDIKNNLKNVDIYELALNSAECYRGGKSC